MDANTAPPHPPKRYHRKPHSVSLVLPAYNEEQVIEQAIREADEALMQIASDYEILVVDDGSSDETASIVQQQSIVRPSIRLLKQPSNRGYGAALARGFRESTKELVAFTDSDCQFDLADLQNLVDLSDKYEVVCGYRIDRKDAPIRKLYSGTYNAIVRCLIGTRVRDVDCALKVFRRHVIQSMEITTPGFFVNSEILAKARIAGRSIVEVGVTHRPRPRGESTVSVLHIIPVVKSLLRFWWTAIQFPTSNGTDSPSPNVWSRSRCNVGSILLICACLAAMLPNLTFPLIEPDETRYVQIALEMYESGDWITPTLSGTPYLDKPPLLYWLTSVSISVLGQNEFAVRLPPVLSAIGTILFTFLLGRRIVGDRAAWCAAIALLLCGGFVVAGRFLIMDSLLTLCTTVCLLTGYLAVRSTDRRPAWWIVSGIACALGVLTKGPVALLLCAPPLIVIGWLRRDQTRTRLSHWVAFTLPMLFVCVPWYVAVWVSNPSFGDYFFWEHNVARFTGGANHQQAWWFYVPVVFAGMFPTSLLLPTLCVFLFSRSESKRRLRSQDLGFFFCGAAWIIGFFSVASCKLPTYILPAMPMICLMLGSMLDRTVFEPQLANRITTFLKPFPQRATMIVLALSFLVALADMTLETDFQPIPRIAIGICIALMLAVIVLWRSPVATSTWAWGGTALLGIASISFTSAEFLGTVAGTRSIHVRAAQLLSENQQLSVVYFRQQAYASSLYIPHDKFVCIKDDQSKEFLSYLDRYPGAIVVTSDSTIDSTRRIVGHRWDLISVGARDHVYLSYPAAGNPSRIAAANRVTR